jgi:hypothetical protein
VSVPPLGFNTYFITPQTSGAAAARGQVSGGNHSGSSAADATFSISNAYLSLTFSNATGMLSR